jgi:hypothetical protein
MSILLSDKWEKPYAVVRGYVNARISIAIMFRCEASARNGHFVSEHTFRFRWDRNFGFRNEAAHFGRRASGRLGLALYVKVSISHCIILNSQSERFLLLCFGVRLSTCLHDIDDIISRFYLQLVLRAHKN